MKAYRNIGASSIQVWQTAPDEAVVEDFCVHPEDRGQGIGRRLMTATCRDADREGVTLLLEPHPFGTYDTEKEEFHPPGLTYKQLCKFYRTFGFRFMPKPNEKVMKRKPKKRT